MAHAAPSGISRTRKSQKLGQGGVVSRITSCTKFSISAPTYNISGVAEKVALARQARRRTAAERSRGFGAGRQSPAPLPRRWGGSAVRGAPVGRGEDKAPRGHARLHPPHGAGARARPPRGAPHTAGPGRPVLTGCSGRCTRWR